MLYYIAKYLMKVALRLYFSRIETSGLAHIDNDRPTLIIANHTNTFMDAIVAGALLKRKIHFFTRGDVFGNPRTARIFRSLGMIPVFRISEGRDNLQRNDSSMEEAAQILAEGGAVIIFAEGASEPQKVVRPLKKGPFRLAAQVAASGSAAPLLTPLGINYGAPSQPLTQLALQGAPPIDSAAFSGEGADGLSRAALQLMRRAALDLETVAWHVKRSEDAQLVDTLLPLKEGQLRRNLTSVEVISLLHKIDGIDDAAIIPLRKVAERYRELLHTLNMPENLIAVSPGTLDALWLCAGALPGFVGQAFHVLPIATAKKMATKWVDDPDYFAPAFLCFSVLTTLAWYLLWAIIGCLALGFGKMILLLVGLSLCGIFYLKIYHRQLSSFAAFLRKRQLRRAQPEAWEELMRLRKELDTCL